MMLRIVFLFVAMLVAQSGYAQDKGPKVADAVIVTKTRDTYTAIYRALEDGTLATTEMTEKEYQALGVVNASRPHPRHLSNGPTWIFMSASKNDEYSTPSGLLEPGDVYVTNEEIFVVVGGEEGWLSLNKHDYVVTDTGGKTLKIKPDPPGFAIENGEIHKK